MTRALAWGAAVLAVVATATGVAAAFRYRPDATGFALGVQRLHAFAGIALAAVLVVTLAVLVWERRPDRRHGLPAFGVVAAAGVLLVVEVWTGWRIAWDQVALSAVTPGLDVRGVFLRDLPLRFVIVDGREVGVTDFRRSVWLHLLVLPVLVAAASAFVVWWMRRTGRRPAGSGGVGS